MSDKYASLGEHGEILVGPSGLQLDNQEMVDMINNQQAENERLKSQNVELLKVSGDSGAKMHDLHNEIGRLKDQYESTPERALKALNAELEEYIEEYGRHESDTGAYVFDSDCCESYANGLERAIEILTAEDIEGCDDE